MYSKKSKMKKIIFFQNRRRVKLVEEIKQLRNLFLVCPSFILEQRLVMLCSKMRQKDVI